MPAMSAPISPSAASPLSLPSPSARQSRLLALISLLALIALCLAWELWLAPTGRGTLAIKALPLALGVLGVWRYRMYTFRWLSLLVWLYAAEGCVRAYGDRGISAQLAAAEVALSVLLFVACAWHVRGRLKAAKLAAAGVSS
ncbi:MAG: DUF2069 domain-containing protein [Burkholderiaceae bacterium]|nr:DUF2069 domain-containing protein [Burkholderiaceae bacterium]